MELCDKCIASAKIRLVSLSSKLDLVFCNHHFQEYYGKLAGWKVVKL